jgi:hypothetical protein
MDKLLEQPLNSECLQIVQAITAFREVMRSRMKLPKDKKEAVMQQTLIYATRATVRLESPRFEEDPSKIMRRLSELRNQRLRAIDEAQFDGYLACKQYIFHEHLHLDLSEDMLFKLHEKLTHFLPGSVIPQNQRGLYKKTLKKRTAGSNADAAKIIFDGNLPGEQTDKAMKQLFKTYKLLDEQGKYSDLQLIAAFVLKILSIQPFYADNAQISRLMMDFLLLKCGYEFCLYSPAETVINNYATEYYLSLRYLANTLSGVPDFNAWFLFFLKVLREQCQKIEQDVLPRKPGTLTKLEDQVLTLIHYHEPVTISFLVRESQIKRPTLKSILARLKDRGTILMAGERKGSRYSVNPDRS